MVHDLVPSISLDALLMKRDAMIERLTAAHRALQEVQEIGAVLIAAEPDSPLSGFRGLRLEDSGLREAFTDADTLGRFIRAIDAQVWGHLLHKSGLWTFMDSAARAKWNEQTDKGEVPELTRANVQATFQTLHGARGDMLERGVLAIFRSLSWDYKTNTPHKLGKRIVMTRAAYFWSRNRADRSGNVEHSAANKLDDLVRVLKVMDKQPEPDHRDGAFHHLNKAQWPCVTKDVELHGVINVRGFLNGNAHVTFLRADLVDQMNLIIAKHHPNALPPKERD